MVTRKAVPVPPAIKTSPPTGTNPPPYPISPVMKSARTTTSTNSNSNSVYSTDLAASPAFDLIDVRQAQQRVRSDSNSSHGTWDSEDTEQEHDSPVEVPKPLKPKSSPSKVNGRSESKGNGDSGLPPSLRIGAAKPSVPGQMHGYEEESQSNPWAGEQMTRSSSNPNNPYLKQNGFVGDGSQAAWQEVKPPMPSGAPPAPPPVPANAPPAPPVQASLVPSSTTHEPPMVGSSSQNHSDLLSEDDRPASWETVEKLPVPPRGQAPLPPVTSRQDRPVSTWWHDSEPDQQDASAFATPAAPETAASQQQHYEPPPGPPPNYQGKRIDNEDAPQISTRPAPIQTLHAPATSSSEPVPDTPGTALQKQRNTTYQIKHVNWLDESHNTDSKTRSQLRNSPIMTQNANGPCPLLAMVNALVLSTPADMETPLLQCLNSREQISLGLLLDAVFDELTSSRRGGSFDHLPDVSELYAFLLALHTGMNVNPRFVTPATTPRGSWDGVPPEMSGAHPVHKAQHKAGAFEETKEMRLYSTFNIPLIHGWIVPAETPVYEAFSRSAPTFEDAQNIQFMLSDLEETMRDEGLKAQETQTLEDIHTIKNFLDTWPTQLTDYGLETMSKSLQPGQIAILFRNDHFSTLYKEPKHGALMTLVTDAGYSGHDEIVWESLVDVNGAASELFSGDFRVVSHGSDVRLNQGNSGGGEEGWTMVSGKGRRKSSKGATPSPPPPPLPGPRPQQSGSSHNEDVSLPMTPEQKRAAEQEDHDLALALQLQEEEENHERQADERRRREQELSEQFISNESEGPRPAIPPRRSQGRGTGATTVSSRAAVNRPVDQEDADAPPSYEQAASDPPYRPAGSTPSGPLAQGNAIGAYDALRRSQSAYTAQSTTSLPTFNQAGPSSPPYSATARRTSNPGNRIRRVSQSGGFSPGAPQRTNQVGFGNSTQRSLVGQGGLSPGHYPGSQQARSMQRINEVGSGSGAAGVKDAEDKCSVM